MGMNEVKIAIAHTKNNNNNILHRAVICISINTPQKSMLHSYHSFSHPFPPRLSSMFVFAQRISIGFFSQNRSCACVRMWSGNELTVLKFDSCRFIPSILWWFIFQVIFFFLFHFVVCVGTKHVCDTHIVKSMYCFVY